MKDSNSIYQITLLKTIIVIYFLYILLNSLGRSVSFFHDNSEIGIWTFISFLIISGFILFVDIATISLITISFKGKNKRVYILILQAIICAIVYFGFNYMFKNADKWNESANNDSQTLQTNSSYKHQHDIYINDILQNNQTFINGLAEYNDIEKRKAMLDHGYTTKANKL